MGTEPKKRAGRPKLAKEKARHVYLAVRLLPEEEVEINAAVAKTSDKKSVWLRKALLSVARGDKCTT
jgi:hypothetical protein